MKKYASNRKKTGRRGHPKRTRRRLSSAQRVPKRLKPRESNSAVQSKPAAASDASKTPSVPVEEAKLQSRPPSATNIALPERSTITIQVGAHARITIDLTGNSVEAIGMECRTLVPATEASAGVKLKPGPCRRRAKRRHRPSDPPHPQQEQQQSEGTAEPNAAPPTAPVGAVSESAPAVGGGGTPQNAPGSDADLCREGSQSSPESIDGPEPQCTSALENAAPSQLGAEIHKPFFGMAEDMTGGPGVHEVAELAAAITNEASLGPLAKSGQVQPAVMEGPSLPSPFEASRGEQPVVQVEPERQPREALPEAAEAETEPENCATLATSEAAIAPAEVETRPAPDVRWQLEAREDLDQQALPGAVPDHAGRQRQRPSRAPRKTMLVVDDDPIIRMLLTMGLKSRHYECLTAEHGQAAQELLQSSRVDVIIVDLLMPVMDGLAFIQWLRQTAQDTTPVLVFTNVKDPRVTEQALQAGANGVLCKPLHLNELVAQIERLVKT